MHNTFRCKQSMCVIQCRKEINLIVLLGILSVMNASDGVFFTLIPDGGGGVLNMSTLFHALFDFCSVVALKICAFFASSKKKIWG